MNLRPLMGPALLLSLTACSGDIKPESSPSHKLCIPDRYSVPTVASTDPNFDSNEGLTLRASISKEEAAKQVSGYSSSVQVGDSQHAQHLYLMLTKTTDTHRTQKPGATRPLGEGRGLLREDSNNRIDWAVYEHEGEDAYQLWGHCTDDFKTDNGFDCLRQVHLNGWQVTYPIHRQNLAVYDKIDAFLDHKLSQWQCDAE